MSLENLPDNVKEKLMDELGAGGGDNSETLLIIERQASFVEEFIRKESVSVRFDGGITWREYPGISRDVFITKIEHAYRMFAAKFKISSPNRLKRVCLQNQFKEHLFNNRSENQRRLENLLRHTDQSNDKELNRFITALLPKGSKEHKKFATQVIKCFIWQVKRKIAGLDVEHHIMPVLFSKLHGTGKSVTLGKLMGPIREFVMHLNLDVFRDAFFQKAFGDNFVGIFDEMQGAGKTDVDSLKRFITAKELSARGMRTQEMDSIQQNCTFIGSSNRPLSDLIFDNTGMRRFVELELNAKADLTLITGDEWDGEEIRRAKNPIDFLKVWQGVSELTTNPILVIKEELEAHQETLRTHTMLEQWVGEFELDKGDIPNDKRTLYNHYKAWLEMQGKKPGPLVRFYKEFQTLAFDTKSKTMIKGMRGDWVMLSQDLTGLVTKK